MLPPVRKISSSNSVVKPQITSLIDVMTILLVFLMKSFSVEGNIITPSNDLTLPVSTSHTAPEPVTCLEITGSAIRAGEEVVTTFDTLGNEDSLLIPALANWLSSHESFRKSEIMLQADRHLPFSLLKRVMFTCSKSGRTDFTILVQQEE